MKKFKSIDKWHLKNRGDVYAVKNDIYRDEENELRDFHDFYPKVEINGIVYKTLGIETFAIPIVREDQPIGILVEEIKNEI